MTKKIENLIEKCANIIPLDGRVLVAPLKLRTYKKLGHTAKPVNPNINEDEIDAETEMVMVEEMQDVNYRFQKAIILQVPRNRLPHESKFDVGDTIIYNVGDLVEFDLIKGVSMLRAHQVIATEFKKEN